MQPLRKLQNWKLEPNLNDSGAKDLAAATLRSIALKYSERKGPSPLKAMLRAISQLKKGDDIYLLINLFIL